MFHERYTQLPFEYKRSDGHKASITISNDGTIATIDAGNNSVLVVHLTDEETIIYQQDLEQSENKLNRVFALSPEGKYLATYGSHWENRVQEEFIHLWDITQGKVVQEYAWDIVFPSDNWYIDAGIMRFQFSEDSEQLIALTVRGEVAIWSTSNGNLLRFIGQSSRHSSDMTISHNGKWFISLEDNVEKNFLSDNRQLIPIGRYYQGDTDLYNLYGYQSRVCYNFERYGNPKFRHTHYNPMLPLGVEYLGRMEPVIFNMCDAYSGAQIRNMTLPIPENVILDRVSRSWNARIVNDFQLSHDDSTLVATVDSNMFLWDTASGDITQIITRDESLKAVGFSQNDRYLVCHDVNSLFVWDIKNQEWVGNYVIDGEIKSMTMSDTNRVTATVWHKGQWSIVVIDISF